MSEGQEKELLYQGNLDKLNLIPFKKPTLNKHFTPLSSSH